VKSASKSTRLIVRVRGDLSSAAELASSLKATVVRRLTLINALVVSASPETAARIREEPWVVSVEQDRKVSAQRQPPEGSRNGRR
jgi:hypothetical protein